ncbi:hypothetical protein GGI07_001459 [Coemansia sp. Benny D115]|nr:hypothetical protein GGI07_001459 [Coemansia sp. Benny D115]
MNSSRIISTAFGTKETLVRHKRSASTLSSMSNNHISLFKLTVSAGNSIEQPIRPSERFSGVLVVQLARPIPASQIVLELSASERLLPAIKGGTKITKSQIFSTSLVVWKPVRKGTAVSTVLSDGIHVFNFSCQMPYLNYPQTMHRTEFDFTYKLEARVLAPREGSGHASGANAGELVVAHIDKELYVTPIVTRMATPDPLLIVETLYFEKKGKKGKPAIELQAAISGHQVIPGTKIKLDISIKELTSTSWTRIVARLYERTRYRENSRASFSQPVWSVDRELASSEVVRSTVYNFFVNDEVLGKTNTETKTVNGETITSEELSFQIPLMPCGQLSSEHLEFSHFIRLEVLMPSWTSSGRFVYLDVPVQIMTHSPAGAARMMSRQASLNNLENRSIDGADNASIISGNSGFSTRPPSHESAERNSASLTHDARAAIVQSLPPRYCEVHPVQRPSPVLMLLKQVNAGTTQDSELSKEQRVAQRMSRQSRSTKHTTMSSLQSLETRTVSSSRNNSVDANDERSRTLVPLPSMAPIPPPLPQAPMPTADISDEVSMAIIMSGSSSMANLHGSSAQLPLLSPDITGDSTAAAGNGDVPKLHISTAAGAVTPVTASGTPLVTPLVIGKQRQTSSGSIENPKSPISPMYVDDATLDCSSDEDAGYFKSSSARKSLERERERPVEKGLFRLRKNSSVKYVR